MQTETRICFGDSFGLWQMGYKDGKVNILIDTLYWELRRGFMTWGCSCVGELLEKCDVRVCIVVCIHELHDSPMCLISVCSKLQSFQLPLEQINHTAKRSFHTHLPHWFHFKSIANKSRLKFWTLFFLLISPCASIYAKEINFCDPNGTSICQRNFKHFGRVGKNMSNCIPYHLPKVEANVLLFHS